MQIILVKAAENMTSLVNNSISDDVVTTFDLYTTLVELTGNILGGASLIASWSGYNTSQVQNVRYLTLEDVRNVEFLI